MPHPRHTLLWLTLTLLLACDAGAERVARFYLEHTITRKVYGPIVNRPGYRFQIKTDGYIVLAAKPGQILFSTYPQTQYLGPYDLEADRIVDLGSQAFTIIRLDSVDMPQLPPASFPGVAVPPSPAMPAPPPAPQPKTTAAKPWTWNTRSWPLATMGWYEPVRRTKYNWTLGGYEGEQSSDMEFSRLGVTVTWGGWFFTAGYGTNGELTDSVLPVNSTVSDLRLSGGSGMLASVGYVHRIVLDRHWRGLIGAEVEYRKEDFDLTATTLERSIDATATVTPDPTTDPTAVDPATDMTPTPQAAYTYTTTTSTATFDDIVCNATSGLEYEAESWGARLEILLALLDDTTTDGTVHVLDNDFSLEGSRSHPLSLAATGWCYMLEGVRAEACVTVGAETALRFGVAYEW